MKKAALLVGINHYSIPNSDLKGCCNDVDTMYDILVHQYRFDPQFIMVLKNEDATTKNIKDCLNKLVGGAVAQDILLFQNSSHGSQTCDLDGDEIDGKDEILCPCDLNWKDKIITDDYLYSVFGKLNPNVQMVVLSDSCHSGSLLRAMNNPTKYNRPKFLNPPAKMLSKIEAFKNRPKFDKNAELKKMELMELNDQLKKLKDELEKQESEFVLLKSEYENQKMEIRKLKKSERPEAYEKLGSEPKQVDNSELNNKIEDLKKKIKESKSDIYANDAKMNAISTNSKKREDFNKRNGILLSGCEANQTSSDAFIDHKFQGAFTYALSKVLKDNNYYITYAKLIVEINRLLDQLGYEQNPQLECPEQWKNKKFLM